MNRQAHEQELQDPSRRSVLKLGVMASVVLGTVGVGAGLAGCHRRVEAVAQGYRFLRDGDVELFRALIPVVLDGAMPASEADAANRTQEVLRRLDLACLRLDASPQKQLQKLFDLLNFGLTRRFVAGVGVPWADANTQDIQAFLAKWRSSSFATLNSGERVLVNLIASSNFGIPASWPSSGYPGPLAWMYKAIHQ
ncbi:MAG TPA: hypothetical protein VN046_07485 [Stenotrophobium sp.]|nr:hypothetical protein [Stenotrophobium sp.]